MPASSTDVRQWAREQGRQVSSRGTLPQHLIDEYAAAHPATAEILESSFDPDMGVTEADFPPDADDYPDDPGPAAAAGGKPKGTRERKPRAVKPPAGKSTFRERIFGRPAAGGAKPKHARPPRASLSDWAEETYEDLALLAKPIPPLARILTMQAPYAGVVFDDQVKGTIVDSLLQPVAQYSGMFRALNGLAGPPVYVGLICATGGYLVDDTGRPVIDQDGQPVYDQRTQMLFTGLRYSLLQMTKIAQVNSEQLAARTQASEDRMAAVEIMINTIFAMPAPPPSAPPQPPPAGGADPANGYRYPDAPVMDDTGASRL